MSRRLSVAAAALLIGVALTAGALALWPEEAAPPPVGGDEPTTPRSLAYVADQHVDLSPTRAGVDWAADDYRRLFPDPKRAVAASINFAGDGNIIVIGVSPQRTVEDPERLCGRTGTCERLGDGVLLRWALESPQEDPGSVLVVAERDDATVVVRYRGPIITGDPRELDLPVPVRTLVDIALDPRVAPTTSQDAVDGGEGLEFWLEGDPVV